MTLENPFFHIISKEIEWAGYPLILEVGRIARRALGSVTVRYRDTVILCTVCAERTPHSGGFLPLSVHYQEKAFSAGRIPGGFIKREGKPSDYEALVSRYIDRMLRPLFPKHFYHEVQIVCTVLSYDEHTDPGVLSMIGASAAILISGLPTQGIAAGVRVGHDEGQFTLSTITEGFDLLLGATTEGPSMIELQALSCDEAFVMEAVQFGYKALSPVFEMLRSLQESVAPKPFLREDLEHQEFVVSDAARGEMLRACAIVDTSDRDAHIRHLFHEWKYEHALSHSGVEVSILEASFYSVWRDTVRAYILEHKKRLDGRELQEIRPIFCETGLLPRCHGSASFTRGYTQAITAVTLGSRQDDSQIVESLSGTKREYFILHYNFPPYSVGEVGKLLGPGRREIGHGRLAQKALVGQLPEDLSCTIRLVSEITESYGSSSMATVCSGSLALMDAGIRLKAPVAGIAMGLISKKNEKSIILSDISGTEDFLGDMDFKVAGTSEGITALQVDLKIDSLSFEIIEQTLHQAKIGRLYILDIMEKQSLSKARDVVSVHAPRVNRVRISVDKIRDLVGPGGKNIKQLCETSKSKIDIADDGQVTIFSYSAQDAEYAVRTVQRLTLSPEVGAVYDAVVKKIVDFGVFVDFGFNQDGLVHVTEIIAGKRLGHPSECLKEGQAVKVRVLGTEKNGKIQLSIRQA